jgi:superfamily I DNA/RNA helicase
VLCDSAGGPRQAAAERVEQIIGQLELSGSTLAKLTKHGESRIKHAVKYDLPGACRLVTIQNDNEVWLMFVGDHAQVESWLEAHKGSKLAANKKQQVQHTIVSAPGVRELPATGFGVTTDTRPLFQRLPFPELPQLIPQARLLRDLQGLTEDSDDDAVVEIVECIADTTVQSLVIDLVAHLRKGQTDEALIRIDLHFGRAKDVVEQPGLIDQALASGENTELVTDLASLSPEERKRILSEDFEPWLLWLHPDQRRIVDEDYDLPAVLKGVSGSGKTVILIHRARRLARKYPTETIGILTLNRSLARLLQNLVRKLCVDGEAERIRVEAFYDYFQSILQHTGTEDYLAEYMRDLPTMDAMMMTLQQAKKRHREIVNEFSPRSGETLEDTWDEFWQIDELEFNKTKNAVVTAIAERGEYDVKAYLRDEFVLIRSAFSRSERGKTSGENNYFAYKRDGRAIGLHETVRQNILRMLRRYEEYMLAGGMMDELTLSQAILPIRTRLAKLPDSLRRRCLLIDEFQDFSTLELSLLKQIPHERENGLFLAGDTVQKVMVKDFNLPAALLDRNYTRTRTITKNYRNSRQILTAAHALVRHYGDMAAKQDHTIEVMDPQFAVRETAPPLAVKAEHPFDVAWKTARAWVEEGGRPAWSVCIVSANPAALPPERILAARPEGVPAERLGGDYILNREHMVVGTLAEVKGFEFSLIIIVGCEAQFLPDRSIPRDEQWRDALRFYVAMTRGRDQVVMLFQNQPSEFLEYMREGLVWSEDDYQHEGARAAPPAPARAATQPRPQPVVIPAKIIVPKKAWDFSPSARNLLLSYFERSVFSAPRQNQGYRSPSDLAEAFEKWLTPKSLNGLRVSELFKHTVFRNDLANEIDAELRRAGGGLRWDQ